MRPITAISAAALATAALLAAGCSSTSSTSSAPSSATSKLGTPTGTATSASTPAAHATEFNPPGDIPDNAVFVDHVAPGSRVHFTVPEGWARSTTAGVTTYTDKYNSISIEVRPRASAPTVASARTQDIPELRRSAANFAGGSIDTVSRQHGSAVHITYLLDSAPNAVTGKVVRDQAERFEFWKLGQEAILTLTGPEHADNVDPWQTVSDSLRWK